MEQQGAEEFKSTAANASKSESSIIAEEQSKHQQQSSIMNNHHYQTQKTTAAATKTGSEINSSNSHHHSNSGGGNNNNKEKKKRSGKHHEKKREPQVHYPGHVHYKNLDEWLENSIKGIQLAGTGDQESPASSSYNVNQNSHHSPFQLFNPLSSYAPRRPTTDPWLTMMPPELNYLNLTNYASPSAATATGLGIGLQQNHSVLHNNSPSSNTHNNNYHHNSHLHLQQQSHLMNNNNNIGGVDFSSLPPMLASCTIDTPQQQRQLNNRSLSHSASAVIVDQNRMGQASDQPTASITSGGEGDDSDASKSTSLSKNSLKLDDSQMNETQMSENNKLLVGLMKQISLLHETNTQIMRRLQETKVEVDALKFAPNFGLRHRRDSISGLSMHSQPLGPAYGTQSPAPTYHSQGNYGPGMVTDVIREVREGTRVREEALLSKVKSMIEERQWSINETNLRVVRELEELKIQMHQLRMEKKSTDEKINRIEVEVAALRNLYSHSFSYQRPLSSVDAIHAPPPLPETNPFMRRPAPYQRLSFGTVHNMTTDEIANLSPSPKRNGRSTDTYANEHAIDGESGTDGQLVQLERDTMELRRELQDAIASKKASDGKIAALEQLVTTLKSHLPDLNDHHYHSNPDGTRSPPGPQRATQVQAVSPKTLLTSTLSLNGPVTDL